MQSCWIRFDSRHQQIKKCIEFRLKIFMTCWSYFYSDPIHFPANSCIKHDKISMFYHATTTLFNFFHHCWEKFGDIKTWHFSWQPFCFVCHFTFYRLYVGNIYAYCAGMQRALARKMWNVSKMHVRTYMHVERNFTAFICKMQHCLRYFFNNCHIHCILDDALIAQIQIIHILNARQNSLVLRFKRKTFFSHDNMLKNVSGINDTEQCYLKNATTEITGA
mgnify:CR=1 FL=1